MKWRKTRGKNVWQSSLGYQITETPTGFEAFRPDGKMIVFWSSSLKLAKESCEEDAKKNL